VENVIKTSETVNAQYDTSPEQIKMWGAPEPIDMNFGENPPAEPFHPIVNQLMVDETYVDRWTRYKAYRRQACQSYNNEDRMMTEALGEGIRMIRYPPEKLSPKNTSINKMLVMVDAHAPVLCFPQIENLEEIAAWIKCQPIGRY
jgi:hypothetical protein